MTLPTLWIRRNMLHSPGPSSYNTERPLTEAEMKVQRSLKKLSIPEWYLNNSSHPPKILMHDTPIDLRPPSWKEQSVKKSVECNTSVMPNRVATINRNGVLETEIGRPTANYQSYGTYNMNRNLPSNRSPDSQKQSSPKKSSRLANISRTFPRVSPSRKIQNINLVFPYPPEVSPLTIADLDVSEPEILMSDDSLNKIAISDDSLDQKNTEPIIQTPPTLTESVMITVLDQSEPKIGIEDSLTLPDVGTIDRRPQTPTMRSDSHIITDLDESLTNPHEINDSVLNQSTNLINQTIEDSRLGDMSFETNTYETKASKMPNTKLTYIKPWKPPTKREFKSCVTPEGKYTTATNFKLRTSSTPEGSPISLFSISTIEAKQQKITENPTTARSISLSKKNIKSQNQVAIVQPISYEDEICDVCKADPSRKRSSPPSNTRPSSGFRLRNLLPSIGETTSSSQSASPSPTIAFLTSTKKSSELENIVKPKQHTRQGKSLVQEIIEELNEKCRNSAQPTYVSPGSKNFVKKLVKALEKGKTPRPREEEESPSYRNFADYEDDEEYDYPPEDHYIESENSEDDVKSVAVSTSISYKDTDSSSNGSDTDIRSPTAKLDYKYDWNMNVEKNRNVLNTTNADSTSASSTPESVEKDNESVYWIPVAKTKLPRTSSLLSMMSRLSTNNPGRQSPCISPIKQTNEMKQNAWGATYRANEKTQTLRRIDETTILDSGYSDRSRGHSSGSDDTWFDDTESTWTASENGSCSNSSYSLGSRLRQERRHAGQIHGRPFVI